jgi:hypothetical protein
LRNTIKIAYGHSELKARNADIRCSAPPWQCSSAYSPSHWSTDCAFQLLTALISLRATTTVYLPEEVIGITALRQWGDGRCPNVVELTCGTSLTGAYKNVFPDMTSASIPAMTMFGSSLSMCVFFVHNFSHCLFC